MLHRDDAAARRNTRESFDAVIKANDEFEESKNAARPAPAEGHRRRTRRQQDRQPDHAEHYRPGDKGAIEDERSSPAHSCGSASTGSKPANSGFSTNKRNIAARYFAYSPISSAAAPRHASHCWCGLTSWGKTGCGTISISGIARSNSIRLRGMWYQAVTKRRL